MTENQPVVFPSEAREGLKSDVTVSSLEALKQQIKTLETQREEVLGVNKQWDEHVKMMKQIFEQKVMEMQKSLTTLQKDNSHLKEGMEQKQREFDKKLILAKQRIEKQMEENENMCAALKEVTRQNQCLHEQNAHLRRKKEQQECEIRRLNNVLEGAMQTSDNEEMRTKIEVLRHQVQIYEEDFKKERNDRETLNDKKEQLESEIHMLKSQLKMFNKTNRHKELKNCEDNGFHFTEVNASSPPQHCCCHRPTFVSSTKTCTVSSNLTDFRSSNKHQGCHQVNKHLPNYQWPTSSSNQLPPDVRHILSKHKTGGTFENDTQ
ncbi:TNFAIP3-interacting protein 3-like isoform X2 [Polypterus senegalus]|uniref:TNFAIP3-interacting protein 3-like isoform X2 n=1 Tax=Polypterus senegalus TaxID=55291 RepID=UPI001963FE95|nr:TNFAIP3-interacting protein 3-like isoform X2 [Polypterus senegalus]